MVALSIAGWLAARAIGARALYLMVYGALVFVGMAWMVGRRRLDLEVARGGLPPRLREGQRIELELKVTAARRVTSILIHDDFHESMGTPFTLTVASLGASDTITSAYPLAPTRRGVYTVGPVTASWGDPFGLTIHHQTLAEATRLIVHPGTEAAHDRVLARMWEDPPVRPPVSKPWPTGFEFYGVRDYVPGDDLRRVVWSVLAKTGRMVVRESEQGITDRVVIVLDTDAQWHSPGASSESFEQAVRVAASVGTKNIDDGFSVTLIANDTFLARSLRGSRSRVAYLDELARVGLGTAPLACAGTLLSEEARTRPHVLVITPNLSEAMAKQLRLLLARGVSVTVAAIIWEESDARALSRAAALGSTVVQIPVGASVGAAFGHAIGGRR